MKKTKSLSFFSVACLSIIFLGMFSVGVRGFTRTLVKRNICPTFISKIIFFDRKDLRSNASEQEEIKTQDELVSVNWKELYPFENEEGENEKSESANLENLQNAQKLEIKLSLPIAEEIKRRINFWCNEAFCLRNFWIVSSKRITNLIVRNMNGVGIFTVGNDKEYCNTQRKKRIFATITAP